MGWGVGSQAQAPHRGVLLSNCMGSSPSSRMETSLCASPVQSCGTWAVSSVSPEPW